jgi:hypothetical protein
MQDLSEQKTLLFVACNHYPRHNRSTVVSALSYHGQDAPAMVLLCRHNQLRRTRRNREAGLNYYLARHTSLSTHTLAFLDFTFSAIADISSASAPYATCILLISGCLDMPHYEHCIAFIWNH